MSTETKNQAFSPDSSPALEKTSRGYPRRWNRQVPRRVRMVYTVTPKHPESYAPGAAAIGGAVYDCYVTSTGELSVLLEDGMPLRVTIGQFDVLEYHERRERPEPKQYQRKRIRPEAPATKAILTKDGEPLVCDCGCAGVIQRDMERVEAWPWVYRLGHEGRREGVGVRK